MLLWNLEIWLIKTWKINLPTFVKKMIIFRKKIISNKKTSIRRCRCQYGARCVRLWRIYGLKKGIPWHFYLSYVFLMLQNIVSFTHNHLNCMIQEKITKCSWKVFYVSSRIRNGLKQGFPWHFLIILIICHLLYKV